MIDRIVIINDLSHAMGGASQLALEAAVQLRRRGYPVTLLCGDEADAELSAGGIDVVALGQGRLLAQNPLQSLARGIYNQSAADMVGRWVARHDTPRTIYHVHGWSQILSPALFRGLGSVRARTLVHAHDFFFTCPNGAMFDFGQGAPCSATPMHFSCVAKACDRRGRAAKVWRLARQAVQDRLLASETPPLLLIHNGMAPYFARSGLGGRDMFVLPNPVVPFSAVRIPAERNRTVLFVGRMEATKGIDFAAEACRRANVKLVAIGTGDLLDTMRARYPEMSWPGRRTHEQILAYAQAARVAVMPSRHIEPFGLAGVEAAWSGLPVICSANALIAADVKEAGAGLAIDPADLDAFTAALLRIFSDDEGTRRMSQSAFTQATEMALSPQQWIETLLLTYEAYLDEGRAGLTRLARDQQHSGLRSIAAAAQPPATKPIAGGPAAGLDQLTRA